VGKARSPALAQRWWQETQAAVVNGGGEVVQA